MEVDPAENEDVEEGEDEEEQLDPSDLKDAQLPDVDPNKIKVEKKDMYGRWCIFGYITYLLLEANTIPHLIIHVLFSYYSIILNVYFYPCFFVKTNNSPKYF